jgi:hypothetical protein
MAGTYYAIVKDDPLDSGGRVIGGNPRSTIEGPDGRMREQAYLGQQAWCAACQSVGVIAPGSGISDYLRGVDYTIGGAKEAVSNDIVICKCARHPRVLAVYGRLCSYIDTDNENTRQSFSTSTSTSTAAGNHWIAFRLNERGSCEGLKCVAHFRDGSKAYGNIDANNTVRFERADNGDSCAHVEFVMGDSAGATGSVTESILSAIAA